MAQVPIMNNKYFNYYKNFYTKNLKEKIEEVYFIKSEKIATKVLQIFSKKLLFKIEDKIFIILI